MPGPYEMGAPPLEIQLGSQITEEILHLSDHLPEFMFAFSQ